MDQKVRSNVPCEEITLLNFNETDFNSLEWEHDKEFMYEGEMYDVVSINKTGQGIIQIRCINDKKETNLLKDFYKQTQDNSSGSTDGKQGQGRYKPCFGIFLPVDMCSSYIDEYSVFSYLKYRNSFISYIGEVPVPPPKEV